MRGLNISWPIPLLAVAALVACGGTTPATTTGAGGAAGSATGSGGHAGSGGAGPSSNIKHVVVVIQENHTFDNHFGHYCTAPAGSNPTCTAGPACCEAAPAKDPSGASSVVLDDAANGAFDPNHAQACEEAEIHGGKMDRYVVGGPMGCSSPKNFAVADAAVVQPYHAWAASYALADRYFQPVAGQSSSNDMYFATSAFVFLDNTLFPETHVATCSFGAGKLTTYKGKTTVGDLLLEAGHTFSFYAQGYAAAVAAEPNCPKPPADCPFHIPDYPCVYDPSDDPFAYYAQFANNPIVLKDYGAFTTAAAAGSLPSVSFVKAVGYRTEHPGLGDTLSAGVTFVKGVVDAVEGSPSANDTLVLVTWDESGGYFDHVAPPPTSKVDKQPYGPRLPLLAIGRFAKKNTVSHVTMEHSSIVRFLEWNFLGAVGQLKARDAEVNNLGSLLDPAETGLTVPDN